jgi:phasin family protein
MSQKPKGGAPVRPAHVIGAAPKEVAAKAAPARIEPAIQAAPPKADPPKIVPVVETPARITTPVAVAPVIKPIVAAPVHPVSQVIPNDTTPKAAMDKAPAAMAVMIESANPSLTPKPSLTQGIKTMMKSTEDFVAFSQANLEAFMKSGQIWSAGVQELTKQMATSAKASFEESVSTFKAISTAKSVKEAMDLQSTFAKAALEKAMAESNKLTDASIKLTEQTLAPITARVTVAVETFGKAA